MAESVLITGGCGYIGSHVARDLAAAGETVVVVDDLSTGFRANLPVEIPVVVADCGDVPMMRRVLESHGVRTILHFAASISVPESTTDPLKYYENNTSKTIGLLKACAGARVREFLFSSTAAVYGDVHAAPVRETDACAPSSPYGRSKLMDEWVLADFGRASSLRWGALRYFNVAGADLQLRCGQRSRSGTHLIKLACEAALGVRPSMTIYGDDYPTPDGTGVRDFIHIVDLAQAHVDTLRYLRSPQAESVVLNCGYGRGYSVKQIVDEVRKASGRDFKVEVGARRPGDVASLIADTTKLQEVVGWVPRHDRLDGIIASALAWERKMHGLD
jgi:UDP-glucose 4-epimerase